MKKQMIFTRKTPQEVLEPNIGGILNFQNLYSVYLFNKEASFQKAITSPNNFTFPDGRIPSLLLRTKQIRGPAFTKNFLENELEKNQKHFFILPEIEDIKQLIKRFPKLKNSKAYSPPYIQNATFPKKEIKKIVKEIKKFKPDYIWVCIGNPKQEILANQLYKQYPVWYFIQ